MAKTNMEKQSRTKKREMSMVEREMYMIPPFLETVWAPLWLAALCVVVLCLRAIFGGPWSDNHFEGLRRE